MTKRDLFRLPVGEYQLTDNIDNFYYTLEVTAHLYSGSTWYRIEENLSNESICMFPQWIDENGDICSSEETRSIKSLSAMSGCGGLCVHSDDYASILSNLKFVPRGSFKEFVKRTNQE